jgi:basic amino acid/polyamine antiporter, APA family
MTGVGERAPAPAKPSGAYERRATGLVREVSPFSTFVFNMADQPTAVFLAVSIFWTLGVFVGGSIWLGFAMTLVTAIVLAVCYGLFTSAIPRSGGDYVLVGRLTHPIVGLVSSFFWTTGVLLSIAFIALAFVTVGLGPSLTAIGLVSGHSGLVAAGDELATSQGWQFGLGSALILGSSFLLAGGWRWTTRIMSGLWVLMMVGLATVFLVLLFKSQNGFINSFNEFASSITGKPDTYHSVIQSARQEGVAFDPAFSMSNTWPVWAAISSLSLYAWVSIYISGEVRRARDTTQVKVIGLASALHIGIGVVMAILFFDRFGHDFFVAINALSVNESSGYPFAVPPYYTFLGSVAGGSTLLTWVLFILFATTYPLFMLPQITMVVRTFFAWALDGLLPSPLARVSRRTHAPNYAIGLTVVLSVAVLGWAVRNGETFYEILIEAVLMQFVTMILLGISAVLLPYRRPDAWRASATTQRFLGLPVVALAGALVAILLSALVAIYMRYPDLGLDKGHFFRDAAIVLGAAISTFFAARAARLRQGVDVDKLAAEIPPE